MKNRESVVNSNIESILFSVGLSATFIAGAIGITGGYIFIFIVLIVYHLLFKRYIKVGGLIFILSVLLISFFVNIANNNFDFKYTIQYLLFFCAICIYIFGFDHSLNFETIVKSNVLIGAIMTTVVFPRVLFLYNHIHTLLQESAAMMSLSYSILTPLMFSVFGLTRLEGRRWKILSCYSAVISLYSIILIGSRGCFICFAVFVCLLFIEYNKSVKKRTFYLIIICTLSAILISNIYKVVEAINSILNRINIHFYAIDKFLTYQRSAKLMNGRDSIWQLCIEGIIDNPFGHGVGSFEVLSNGTYIHNVFLEIAWEFGVFAMLVAIVLFFYFFIRILCDVGDVFENATLIILFSNSIVLLFSSYYWKNFAIWFLVYYYLFYKRKTEISIQKE